MTEKKLFQEILKKIKAEKPKKSDAIVWLQGDRYDRAEKVLELYQEKWAPIIVISGNNELLKKRRVDERNISLEEMEHWLRERSALNIWTESQSKNTREQAVNVLDLAQRHQWSQILLVASPYHQPRAFLSFLKRIQEEKIQTKIINQPANLSWHRIPAGRSRPAKKYLNEELKKISLYRKHNATLLEGITYLSSPEFRTD